MLCVKINIDVQVNKDILYYYLVEVLFKMQVKILTDFKKMKFIFSTYTQMSLSSGVSRLDRFLYLF